ncbi:lipoprotein [Bordetella ansorpii]|uniref:Lipoprotein n=1 Tax=Bordetella ansorpii TaxID=288768 RepID=A0A157SV21_9BORD|nr:alkaline phosphatase family protein [Bordetella ansorpii]SAI73923.1 lipoprotein [Bordetella ansorpii]
MSYEAPAAVSQPSACPAARSTPRAMRRLGALRLWTLSAAACVALAACGGDHEDSGAAAPPPVAGDPGGSSGAPPVPRTLLVSLDGATYAAVQQGIAAGTLPNLAKLQVRLAYAGGVAGSASQQPTLDTPGWATILTGTWGNRHRVISSAPDQALRSPTLFQAAREHSVGLAGAAVASQGLARLLATDRETGNLDALTDCGVSAPATDCVTDEAARMIDAAYTTVLAQYHSASDAVLNYGQNSAQYAGTLVTLDKAIGRLVDAAAQRKNEDWLIAVTGNHGFSANSQDDGLPLVPESATFIAMNRPANTAELGVGAEVPQQLDALYDYASLADLAPTLMRHLGLLPATAQYLMDGGALVGQQAVSKLSTRIVDDGSADVSVILDWNAPPEGTLSVLRNGEAIATQLPAGTATFTDNQLGQFFSAKTREALNYTVEVSGAAGTAARATMTTPVSYVPPVPLAETLRDGLVSYYPFSANLPPVDATGHSTMAPYSADLPPAAGLVVAGPFPGTNGLLVDTNYATAEGLEGYKLTPAQGFDVSQGTTPQFTIGLWFKTPTCIARNNVTIISNKSYVSGGNAGVAIGLFSSSGNQCGIAFNIGSGGGVRADGPLYTQITVDRWVYLAFSVDGVARTMNMTVFDPVTGVTNRAAVGKSTGSVDLSRLSPYPQWGLGSDGTGTFLMNKCNGSVTPPYYAGKCTVAPTFQQMFGDLAMWNRVLTDAELQSIFLSNKPLSTLDIQ